MTDLVENQKFEICLLSEQLSEAFNENLLKNKEIDSIRDANLQLRSQIVSINKDFAEAKEIFDLQSMKCEVGNIIKQNNNEKGN